MPILIGVIFFAWLNSALAQSDTASTPPPPPLSSEQQEQIDLARIAIEEMRRDQMAGDNVEKWLGEAKAVMIFPNLFRAGFFLGGSGGGGVLLVKNRDGTWSDPAFYFLGGVSLGVQFGAKQSQVLMLIMTDGGLDQIMSRSVKLGGEVSLAAGPVGAENGAATTANFGADILIYARASGLFGGVAAEGSIIQSRDAWNQIYYRQKLFPRQIVFDHAATNPGSLALRQALRVGGRHKTDAGNQSNPDPNAVVIPAPPPIPPSEP
ncbi:MAG: lipid-binding SYLF domain-containing protein [Candidatus Symbiobacter sp.]|nr:lipid-binding SYLF domain-containing protein [Candidatus Symbiobacter sp.]